MIGRAVADDMSAVHFVSFSSGSEAEAAFHPAVAHSRSRESGEPPADTSSSSSATSSPSNDRSGSVEQFGPGPCRLRDGSLYFLLEMRWWLAVQPDPSLGQPVPPIDNSPLLDAQGQLRADLEQDVDFVMVTPEAWAAYAARFGGGPPIMRQALRVLDEMSLVQPSQPAPIATSAAARFMQWARLSQLPDCGSAAGPTRCFVCRRAAQSRCAKCAAVYYCSADCQRSHWSVHRRWCAEALRHSALEPTAFSAKLRLHRRGLNGLLNLGNTCFLSAGLQCLSHVAPLTGYFLSGEYKRELNAGSRDGTGGELATKYELLLRDLWFDAASVSPKAVKDAVARKDPIYSGLSQQDAHEFIERFLDWLQEDVNRVVAKPYVERPEGDARTDDAELAADSWAKDKMRNDSIVNELLGGQMRSQLQCPSCAARLVRFDYFHTMQLALPHQPRDDPPLVLRLLFIEETDFATPARRPADLELRVERGDSYAAFAGKLARALGLEPAAAEELAVAELLVHRDPNGMWCELGEVFERDGAALLAMAGRRLLGVYRLPAAGTLVVIDQLLAKEEAGTVLSARAGYPLLTRVEARTGCQRFRFKVWLAVRRSVRRDFWREVCRVRGAGLAGDEDDSLEVRAAMEDVQLNSALAARLPLRLCDGRGRLVPMEASAAPPRSDPALAAFLGSGGFCEDAALVGGDGVPHDQGTSVGALLAGVGEGPPRFTVVWSDAWLDNLQIDELTASTRRPAAPAAPARAEVTLQECLGLFTAPERLDEQNSWYCGSCKEHRRATKTVKLWRLPEVLVLSLKRFEVREGGGFGWSGPANVKIEAPVDFPIDGLDLRPFCHEGARIDRSLYDLFAVCNHYGRMGFGHYTAFARDWEGDGLASRWSCFDDNSVEPCSEDDVRSATRSSYILFYRKRVAPC